MGFVGWGPIVVLLSSISTLAWALVVPLFHYRYPARARTGATDAIRNQGVSQAPRKCAHHGLEKSALSIPAISSQRVRDFYAVFPHVNRCIASVLPWTVSNHLFSRLIAPVRKWAKLVYVASKRMIATLETFGYAAVAPPEPGLEIWRVAGTVLAMGNSVSFCMWITYGRTTFIKVEDCGFVESVESGNIIL